MTPATQFIAESSSDDSGKQLFGTIVVVLVFIPIFWSIRRKVKSGKIAPNDRRTNPHSRTYLVVIASLNVVLVVFFVSAGVLSITHGDVAFGVSGLLLAALISTFVWMIFRQGSTLRREGLSDQAPSEAQKHLSRPRRVTAFIFGSVSGLTAFGAVGAVYDQNWGSAVAGAVIVAVTFGISWWLYRPLRKVAKAS